MSDPATLLERVERRLRRHWQHRDLTATTRELRARLLNTPARRERSCGNPYCPCADVTPACPQWEGGDRFPDRCPCCGAPRANHDERAGAT